MKTIKTMFVALGVACITIGSVGCGDESDIGVDTVELQDEDGVRAEDCWHYRERIYKWCFALKCEDLDGAERSGCWDRCLDASWRAFDNCEAASESGELPPDSDLDPATY